MRCTSMQGWAVVLAFVAMSGAGAAERVVWQGQSGGAKVKWTSSDLTVEAKGKPVSVFRERAQQECQEIAKDLEESELKLLGCDRTYQLLSVVGPYLSFKSEAYSNSGGAHPSMDTSFLTVRVEGAKPREVLLTELFPEAALLEALLADSLVAQALKEAEAPRPTTLAGLVEALDMREIQPPKDPCGYFFEKDFARHFAFHHVEKKKVAVRVGLSPASGACRGQHAQLGLLLPVSSELAPLLDKAAARKEGFLMKDAKKVSGGATTKVAPVKDAP